jgi:hypothetical protein
MTDDKFRSRRWMLANNILIWSRVFAAVALIIGVTIAREHIGSIITGVLTFLGGVHALVYGAYTANHAFTDRNDKNV